MPDHKFYFGITHPGILAITGFLAVNRKKVNYAHGSAIKTAEGTKMLYQQNRTRPFELAQKIEDYILWKLACNHLIARQSGAPEHEIHLKPVDAYNHFVRLAELERNETEPITLQFQTLTAGSFNRVVEDMKKAGLIGIAKGGSILYLTEASRKEWVDSGRTKLSECHQTTSTVGGKS